MGNRAPSMTARGRSGLPLFSLPPVLDLAYAQQYGAGKNWWFLTGPLSEIYRIAREGFKLAVEENPPEAVAQNGKMLHSTKIAMVDGQGRIRGYYNGTDADLLARILPDLGDLMRESAEGSPK